MREAYNSDFVHAAQKSFRDVVKARLGQFPNVGEVVWVRSGGFIRFSYSHNKVWGDIRWLLKAPERDRGTCDIPVPIWRPNDRGEILPVALAKLEEWLEKGCYSHAELEGRLNGMLTWPRAWEWLRDPNPVELWEHHHRVVRGDKRSKAEKRHIQDDDWGRFCPVATPEDTELIGLDLRLAWGAEFTPDGVPQPVKREFLSATARLIPFVHFDSPARVRIACRMLWKVDPKRDGEEPYVRTGMEEKLEFAKAGLNALVGFIPWKGYNYEDAIVVSDSFSKRLGVETGDKICNRHGHKGVAVVLPDADIPVADLPDGPKRLDMLVNPLTIEKRGNFGQLLEAAFTMAPGLWWRKDIAAPFQFGVEELAELRRRLGGTDGKYPLRHRDEALGTWPVGFVCFYKLVQTAKDALLVGGEDMPTKPTGEPLPTEEERAIKVEERMLYGLLARGADRIAEEFQTVGSDANFDRWRRAQPVSRKAATRGPETVAVLGAYFLALGVHVIFSTNKPETAYRLDASTFSNPSGATTITDPEDLRRPASVGVIRLPYPISPQQGVPPLHNLRVLPYKYRPKRPRGDHPITRAYREVVTAIEHYRRELGADDTQRDVEAAVRRAFTSVRKAVGGKGSLLRSMTAKRQRLSARGVIVPAPELGLDEVYVPHIVLDRLFPKGNAPSWVLVNRNPSISLTSALGFRIHRGEGDAVGLHPTVVGAIQGDFDGDCVNLFFPMTSAGESEVARLALNTRENLRAADGGCVLALKQELFRLRKTLLEEEDVERTIRETFEAGPRDPGKHSKSLWEHDGPLATGLGKKQWCEKAEDARKAAVWEKLLIPKVGDAQRIAVEALFCLPDRIGIRAGMILGEKVNQAALEEKLETGEDYLSLIMGRDLKLDRAIPLMRRAGVPKKVIKLVRNELQEAECGLKKLAADPERRSTLAVLSVRFDVAKLFRAACARRTEADDLKAWLIKGACADRGPRFFGGPLPLEDGAPEPARARPIAALVSDGHGPVLVMLRWPRRKHTWADRAPRLRSKKLTQADRQWASRYWGCDLSGKVVLLSTIL